MEKNNKLNNEYLGISAEIAIADYYNITTPDKYRQRGCEAAIKKIKESIQLNEDINLFRDFYFVGNESGERGKNSKSSIDFYANVNDKKITISVKTNIGKVDKVCPSEMGQPSLDTFNELYAEPRGLEIKNKTEFKEVVFEQIEELLQEYWTRLFVTDYIFHFQKRKGEWSLFIVNSKISKDFKFKREFVTFTKKTVEEWNESNTVKYNGKSIGEFQVHNNRNSLKFRFNWKAVIELIENYK